MKLHTALVLAGLLLIGLVRLQAEPLRIPAFTVIAGQALDFGSSVAASNQCREANPTLAATNGRFDVARGLLVKGAVIGAALGLLTLAHRTHQPMLGVASRAFAYTVGIGAGVVGVQNLARCGP